ncbi:hypothetical protein L0F51_13230 [Afifella sp. H1R]|uniref:hypothetical protein n=1 Tax=Afifella sp. H1R TaxID=2908841 RepID=UPI001F341150|nr:hypothetical protein [Afifella sp. H1R]MCF1504712.1 hypothetical protein [Afifella sp. H1R]
MSVALNQRREFSRRTSARRCSLRRKRLGEEARKLADRLHPQGIAAVFADETFLCTAGMFDGAFSPPWRPRGICVSLSGKLAEGVSGMGAAVFVRATFWSG